MGDGQASAEAKAVVSIFEYNRNLRYPAIDTVEAYWQGLRHGQTIPARRDVNPRGIENALEYAFIAERIAPGIARLRLAGMHLSDLLGLEVRGMPLASFIEPQDRIRLSDALETVFAQPSVVEMTLRSEGRIGQPPLDGKMILLPLLDDDRQVTRVLGALETRSKLGRAPRRCTICDVSVRPVETDAPRPVPNAQDRAAKLERELATVREIHAKRALDEKRPALTLIDCQS